MAEDMAKERLVYRACQWTMGGEDKETPPPPRALTKQDPLAAPPAQFGPSASGEGTRSPPSDSRSSHTPGIIPCTPSRRRPPQRPSSMLSITHPHHTALKHSTLVTAAPSVAPASARDLDCALTEERLRAHPVPCRLTQPTHPGGTPIPGLSASLPSRILSWTRPPQTGSACRNSSFVRHATVMRPRTPRCQRTCPLLVTPLSALCRPIKRSPSFRAVWIHHTSFPTGIATSHRPPIVYTHRPFNSKGYLL